MSRSIPITQLIEIASDLRSVLGENKEYDRALVELVADAVGLTEEERPALTKIIGIGEAR